MLAVGVVALLTGARDTETVAASAPTTLVDVADVGERQAAVRLGWIMTMRDPVPAQEAAVACVRAGAACDLGGMLATDSARLQVLALVGDLETAIDPLAPGFDPLPPDTTHRAREVVVLARQVEQALGAWLSTGCGSSIDGVAVEARPADCDVRSGAALGSLAVLRSAISAWPR